MAQVIQTGSSVKVVVDSPSITIGEVTTLSPGQPATVVNVGTDSDAILDFGIPRGVDGSGGGSSDATTLNGQPGSYYRNFANATNKPTTLAGYGITDAQSATGSVAWSRITATPTTLSGYGITDAQSLTGSVAWSRITGTPTTRAGYGITDAQPLDAGLTSLANLSTLGLYYLSANDVWSPVTIGANITFSGGTLSATGGGGGGGDMFKADNLSGLTNYATARSNLGLGTLATQNGTFSGTSSGTNTGDQTITLTGPVTGSGTGSFATTITDKAVTLAKMADVPSTAVFYRRSAGTGVPEVQPLSTLKSDLGLFGINSGDYWDFNFSAAGSAIVYIPAAMTIDLIANEGTSYSVAKSTAAAPSTYTTGTLPFSVEGGARVKVTATAACYVALKRTV